MDDIVLNAPRIVGKTTVRWLFRFLIVSSVLFTVACTIGLILAWNCVRKPFREVQKLATENPVQSSYMANWREDARKQGKPDSIQHRFVPLDSISKPLQDAVIASEDDGFWAHHGFDTEAILSACSNST